MYSDRDLNSEDPKALLEYFRELLTDRCNLSMSSGIYIHVTKILEKEILMVRGALFGTTGIYTISEKELPDPEGSKVKLQAKIFMPTDSTNTYNFVGRILGPDGSTAKALQQCLGVKIMIRGRGSMRDRKKEEANIGRPHWEHLNDDLHVLISVEDYENRAKARLAKASEYINMFLNDSITASDKEDKVKQMQLLELAIRKGVNNNLNPISTTANHSSTPPGITELGLHAATAAATAKPGHLYSNLYSQMGLGQGFGTALFYPHFHANHHHHATAAVDHHHHHLPHATPHLHHPHHHRHQSQHVNPYNPHPAHHHHHHHHHHCHAVHSAYQQTHLTNALDRVATNDRSMINLPDHFNEFTQSAIITLDPVQLATASSSVSFNKSNDDNDNNTSTTGDINDDPNDNDGDYGDEENGAENGAMSTISVTASSSSSSSSLSSPIAATTFGYQNSYCSVTNCYSAYPTCGPVQTMSAAIAVPGYNYWPNMTVGLHGFHSPCIIAATNNFNQCNDISLNNQTNNNLPKIENNNGEIPSECTLSLDVPVSTEPTTLNTGVEVGFVQAPSSSSSTLPSSSLPVQTTATGQAQKHHLRHNQKLKQLPESNQSSNRQHNVVAELYATTDPIIYSSNKQTKCSNHSNNTGKNRLELKPTTSDDNAARSSLVNGGKHKRGNMVIVKVSNLEPEEESDQSSTSPTMLVTNMMPVGNESVGKLDELQIESLNLSEQSKTEVYRSNKQHQRGKGALNLNLSTKQSIKQCNHTKSNSPNLDNVNRTRKHENLLMNDNDWPRLGTLEQT